jgi:outer membrane receptor protein involved in Fe transport
MITGVALAAVSAGGVFAQSAPMNTTGGENSVSGTGTTSTKVQEFVVTGSRIPSPNLNSISPVTAVNSNELKLEGTTRVEDLINQLPQVVGGQSGFLSITSSGTATVNLRGLGPQRNLVLIDGTRLGAGSIFSPVADLNFIPTPLIQRVDALTGGASATYGADAVAGVVNFIMKKDYSGLELTVNYDGYQHYNGDSKSQAANAAKGFTPPTGNIFDGQSINVSLIFGANSPDGKGNVEGYLNYLHTDPVTQSTRDYSNCVLGISHNTNFACSGSHTSSPANFFVNPGPLNPTYGSPLLGLQPSGLILPDSASSPASVYNYGAPSYFLRQDQRYQGGFYAHYDLTSHITAYSNFMFMHDQSLAQYGPSGDFGTTVNVPCNDPQLTAQEVNQLCVVPGYTTAANPTAGTTSLAALRRNVEGGPRIDDRQFLDYRAQIGLKGDLSANWHFDVYGQYYTSIYSDNQLNFINNSRLPDVFNVVPGPNGTAVCASGNAGCVPYNIFNNGGVTAAQTAYLSEPGIINGSTSESVIDASITGDLTPYGGKSPFAKDGIGVSFGTEYRRETLSVQPDAANQTGSLGGSGTTLPVSGAFDVKELFAEARIPLAQDLPFIKDLTADAGYRFSHYNDVGNTSTYKIGLEWAVNDDVRIRGGFNRAVRAPNIQELYAPQILGLPGSNDPCANAPGVAPQYTQAQCARTGVSAAQYGNVVANSAAQYNGIVGGNPNLKPESANTYTVGVVITPVDLVKGLSLSADYFNIYVSNVITTYGFQNILNGCAIQDNSTYCALIHRDPVSASLWRNNNGYIIDTNANLGYLKTDGVDFTLDYHFRFKDLNLPDWGGLTFNFLGTYTNQFVQQGAVGTPLVSCAGQFGPTCGPPQPFFKGKTRLSWSTPIDGLEASLDWRYIGSANVDSSGVPGRIDSHIPSYSYFDLAAQWRVKDRYTFSVGVNNIFDIQPPLIGSGNADSTYSNGNTYPQIYDPLGRYLFASITADF